MVQTKTQQTTSAQKMMIFVLTMSLYGLATLFSELIPEFHVGIVELSVEYFLFIPLTLGMLFDPLSAALGAATGELIFSEIMLGQFGGLGELEKFLTLTIALYIAGRMVKDPKNIKMVGIASILSVIIQQAMSCTVDILKVQFAVEDFEAVAGLPESVFLTEGFSFLNDVLFSGILFCLLPTLYLVPRLYGKIEPLLGLKPRDEHTVLGNDKVLTPKVVLLSIVGFAVSIAAEFLSESDLSLIDWEAEWAESSNAIIISIAAAVVVAIILIAVMRKRALDSKND